MSQTIIHSAVDDRFRIRGPYWRPGESVIAEPWVALCESNVGHLVVPYGRRQDRARELIERWEALTKLGRLIDYHRTAVGAAVVNPRGEVVAGWGSVPVPGGAPRWAPLHRLMEPAPCAGCSAPRWPGCWMVADLSGCAVCQPTRESADPRVWPPEPSPPVVRERVVRVKTPVKRKSAPRITTLLVSPDQGRL